MKPKDKSACLVCAGALYVSNNLSRLHLSSSGDLCRSSLRPWARDTPANFRIWFPEINEEPENPPKEKSKLSTKPAVFGGSMLVLEWGVC